MTPSALIKEGSLIPTGWQEDGEVKNADARVGIVDSFHMHQKRTTAADSNVSLVMRFREVQITVIRQHVQAAAKLLLYEMNRHVCTRVQSERAFFKCWPVIMYIYHMLGRHILNFISCRGWELASTEVEAG